jgi:hypothetical protein
VQITPWPHNRPRLEKIISFVKKNRVSPNFRGSLTNIPRAKVQNLKIIGRGIFEIFIFL